MSDPLVPDPTEFRPAVGPLPEYAVEGDPRAGVFRRAVEIAGEAGVRVLMAGGVVYVQLGLISPRQSRALSVIVDPGGVDALLGALSAAGWGRTVDAPDPSCPPP